MLRPDTVYMKRHFEAPCGFKYIKDYKDLERPYKALTMLEYCNPTYGQYVTVRPGDRSDGATGAFDVASISWWVHDQLCNTGQWDSGLKLTNWQCSTVLSNILWAEGRYFRAVYWKWATFLFGGGKARENGMFKLRR